MDSTDVAAYRANALRIVGPWSVHDDSQGHLFYYNLRTKQSRWEMPREDPAFAKRDVSALEGELLMALMLQNALARSGPWSAHDTGSGTLYYFNEKSRASVWERPAEWGTLPPPPPPLPLSDGEEEDEEQGDDEKEAEHSGEVSHAKLGENIPRQKLQEEEQHSDHEEEEEEEEAEPPAEPTPEELEAIRAREAAKQKSAEQFRQMLREKRIMPFCKWSVALPRIAMDPRFMAVPTMEDRREIFDRFVEHRREDLQQEKKANLKRARRQFTELVREHFERNLQELVETKKPSLSVFLTMLEDQLEADRFKKIQEDALAFLPLSVQEKLFTKVFDEFSVHAKQLQQEEERWRQLVQSSSKTTVEMSWESDATQELRKVFAEGKPADTKELPIATQQRVFQQVVELLTVVSRRNDEEHNTEKHAEPHLQNHAPKVVDRSSSRRDQHHHDDLHHKSSHRRSPSRSRSRSRGRSGRDRYGRRSRSRDSRRHDLHDHDRSRSRRHRSPSRSRRRRSRSYSSSRSRSPRR